MSPRRERANGVAPWGRSRAHVGVLQDESGDRAEHALGGKADVHSDIPFPDACG